MKRRILTKLVHLLLTAALCAGLTAGAAPAGAFSDLYGDGLSEAVEVLSSLGIVSGYSDGGYHPSETLTRAQFCKLAVLAEGHGDKVKGSAYRSLFSDVSASDWAAPYVNLAYEEGLVSGYGNGTFGPDDPVTVGQAVTVALHLLGYSNDDIGPFWPEDYMSKAADLDLVDGALSAYQSLTRGDAALLLYAMIRQDTAEGQDFAEKLSSSTVSDAVVLSNDAEAADGTLHTVKIYTAKDGLTWYEQSEKLPDALVGRRGTLLLDASGEASGFLPGDSTCVTVSIDSVTAAELTAQNGRSYAISSGAAVILEDEKKTFSECWYDLENSASATLYYTSSGSVDLVVASEGEKYTGTLITGCYDSAVPNAAAPSKITVLGVELAVAEGAKGLTDFAIGDKLTVELNGAGEVKAAYPVSEKKTEVIGILSGKGENGSIQLTCGLTAKGTVTSSASVGGLVKVTSSAVGKLSAYTVTGYSGSGKLNAKAKTLGSLSLADDVKIYDRVGTSAAVEVDLDEILVDSVPASKIEYVGTNSAGQVSVILLQDVTGSAYTYGILHGGSVTSGEGDMAYTNKTVSVENASGTSEAYVIGSNVSLTTMGGLAVSADGKVAGLTTLTKLDGVTRSGFDGTDAAVVDGMRTPISDDVQVYNTDTLQWTTLTEAKAFTDRFTVYYSGKLGEDAVIRIIYTA